MENNQSIKVLIFGATGWLGKSTIDYFSRNQPSAELILVSSLQKEFNIQEKKYKTISLEEFKNLKDLNIDYFFNYAFLTGNKVKDLSENLYIKKSDEIIFSTKDFIKNNEINKALLASSGAVYWKDTKKQNTYSIQKLKQEEVFKSECNKYNVNLQIARIFAVLANPEFTEYPYAFTDFVKQAKNNKKIHIKSNVKVLRSYLYFDYLIDFFLNGKYIEVFDAWNLNIDIAELSEIIANFYNAKVYFDSNYSEKIVDEYVSSNYEFFNYFHGEFDVEELIKKIISN